MDKKYVIKNGCISFSSEISFFISKLFQMKLLPLHHIYQYKES